VKIGEIASPTAGDQNLFADAIRMIEHDDTTAALPCFDGAH
jgi:hypothetical protein